MWLSQCARRNGWFCKCKHDGLCVRGGVRPRESVHPLIPDLRCDSCSGRCAWIKKSLQCRLLRAYAFTSQCLVKVGVILVEGGIKALVRVRIILMKEREEKRRKEGEGTGCVHVIHSL